MGREEERDRERDDRHEHGRDFDRGYEGRGTYDRGGYDTGGYSGRPRFAGRSGHAERGYYGERGGYGGRGGYAPGGSGESGGYARDYTRSGYGHSQEAYTEARKEQDEGPYAGVGPRGYRRSDERILEEVCERMTHHGALDASPIHVRVEDNEVFLEGTVESRRAKRLADDIADSVSGVRDVHNRLRVRRTEAGDERAYRQARHDGEDQAQPDHSERR